MSSVSDAGYLARKLLLLLLSTNLDKNVEDCGVRPLLDITIDSEKVMERFANRYVKLNSSDKEYTLITKENYKDFTGKKLLLASPITCNLSKENGICKTCYGKLANQVTFHTGVSMMLKLTEQITQKLLSSKHLLKVVVNFIDLGEELSNFLEVDKNNIVAINDFTLRIISSTYNDDYLVIHKFLIEHDGKEYIFNTDENLEFHLPVDRILTDDDDNIYLDVKSGEDVFNLDLQSNGLATVLKRLLSLIESGEKMSSYSSVQDLTLAIIELLCDSDIKLSALGAELVVRELARNPSARQEKAYAEGGTEFLRLTSAIMESPSLAISLSFQDFNKLLNGRIFNKTKSSPLDIIY